MKNTLTIRIIANILILAGIIWGSWLVVLSVAIFFIIFFEKPYEVLLFAFIYDSIYSLSSTDQGFIASMFQSYETIVYSAIAILIVTILKPRILFFTDR